MLSERCRLSNVSREVRTPIGDRGLGPTVGCGFREPKCFSVSSRALAPGSLGSALGSGISTLWHGHSRQAVRKAQVSASSSQ